MAGGSAELTRAAGILLPVFSLPGPYGIGAFSDEAYRFVDFLREAGQSYWQILPIGPTSYGDSPYQSFCTYAGNPYFIDLDSLVKDGLLTEAETAEFRIADDAAPIDYAHIYDTRFVILKKAHRRFIDTEDDGKFSAMRRDYAAFCATNAWWVDDFALFIALKAKNGGKSFLFWEEPLRLRDPEALDVARVTFSEEIDFHRFLQFLFYGQYDRLKSYANKAGIRIIGDIPIYVAPDSSDVWANPELFQLDKARVPTAVAGCPPDAFSATGQLWGNPLYNWKKHEQTGFAWWIRRLKSAFALCDVLRIDHFRGFESYYSIPWGHDTAEFGHWEKGPGMKLFDALKKELGDVPVIAEDLGFLTPEVLQMVRDTGYPGMKVLQFAFDSREDSDYLPHNYTRNCVVYTGTHDNCTTNGWFEEISTTDRAFACDYLDYDETADGDAASALIRTALASVATTAVIPMQDWLGLGNEARINHPSTLGGNWLWRMNRDALTEVLKGRIRRMTKLYGRLAKETADVEFG